MDWALEVMVEKQALWQPAAVMTETLRSGISMEEVE
jgi:hypothetical protein